MKPEIIRYTHLKSRLQLIKSTTGPYNWVFLPGGPGLGSESLCTLTENLQVPGKIWHLDLPGDGSNTTSDDAYYFERWPMALVEAVTELDTVVLVAHSTGAMYALATPELKNLLHGFVIMDSAPDASWQGLFMNYVANNPLPEVERLQQVYAHQQSNENIKQLTLASMPYFVTTDGLKKDISFFEQLPYNARACEWSAQNFDQIYKAQWVPDNMPTLIFAGDQDHITPLDLFVGAEKFHHPSIVMRVIPHAGHFPWVDNFEQVQAVFQEYCRRL